LNSSSFSCLPGFLENKTFLPAKFATLFQQFAEARLKKKIALRASASGSCGLVRFRFHLTFYSTIATIVLGI